MPSEKMRYLKNCGPRSPLNFKELKKHLPALGAKRLAEIIWLRAQYDSALGQAIMGSIAIQLANGDWEATKAAIDYALHLPDHIRYSEGDYGIILDEITVALEYLHQQGKGDFARKAAQYTIELATIRMENFEDGWGWECSLDMLVSWASQHKPV